MKLSTKLFPLYIIPIIFVFYSCGLKVSTSISKKYGMLTHKENVIVFGLQDSMPKKAEVLGEVKVGNTVLTENCSWAVVVERAKFEARKVGGNAIKITRHIRPNVLINSCHQISAKILKVNYDNNFIEETSPDLADYAVLHIYRHNNAFGFMVGFNLYLGDSLICRVSNNYQKTIKIKKEGLYTLWAQTEAPDEVFLNLEHGKEYYVRCSIILGKFVGHPKIELVKNNIGRVELQTFNLDGKSYDHEYNDAEKATDDIYYKPGK